MRNSIFTIVFAIVSLALSAFRTAPAADFAAQPDLVIKEVIPNCQMPELFVVVCNAGTEVSRPTTITINPADAQAKTCIKDRKMPVPALKPGECTRIRFALTNNKGCFCKEGLTVVSMDFKFFVDAANTNAESDETNNTFLFNYHQ